MLPSLTRRVTAPLSIGLLAAGVTTAGAVFVAPAASAALPDQCVQSGTTVTCTYSSDATFTVPAGITSFQVTAVGGEGADGADGFGTHGDGGSGAAILTTIAVGPQASARSGDTLTVTLGGNAVGATGGANGGGDGLTQPGNEIHSGGGGGGATTLTNDADLLVVAAGGGGGGSGSYMHGGDGGDADGGDGTTGEVETYAEGTGNGGEGGQGGEAGLNGAGGPGGTANHNLEPQWAESGDSGQPGTRLNGGDGAAGALDTAGGGGGGGAGYTSGGGGGAGGHVETGGAAGAGGGGGAGTSYSVGTLDSTGPGDGAPRVVITYLAVVKKTQTIDTRYLPAAGFVGWGAQLQAYGGGSGRPVTFASTTPVVCSVTPSGLVTYKKAGTCTLKLNQAGNAQYLPADTVTHRIQVFGLGLGR